MRDHPHPRALFSLVPLTGEAKQVLNYAGNKHLVSRLVDGRLAIDVGHLPFKSASILATLGRAEDATIKVPHPRISKIQCTFEINLDSRIIMLYDRSSGSSTQSQGSNAFPFEFGRPYRRIALMKGINERIGFGGPSHDLFLFKIHWHQTTLQQTVKKLEALATVPRDYADELQQDPMNAHTVDEPNTVLPSRVETSVQTLGNLQRTLRYVGLEALGQGAYGEVHKAVDIDSGRLVAVKIVRLPAKDVKREVEVLQELVHDHIVEYIHAQQQQGESQCIEIFMGLKEGTLESLIQSNPTLDSPRLPYTILHEMLQALDYLAVKKIVHRDIKPANILYLSLPDRVASKETPYLFQLGDFGLSDRLDVAKTRAGTKFFMAPEVFKEEQQTLAADIWSLFVTMLWVVDKEFRQYSESEHHHGEIWDTVTRAASGQYKNIGRMGEFAPSERATAAQMLVEHFNGEGLTTPRMQIPPFMDRKKT